MSRMIQAYFHTENQAEHARILLLKYSPDMLEVGRLPDGYNGTGRVLLPFVDGVGTGGETNLNSGVGIVGVMPTVETHSSDAYWDKNEDEDALHYVLSAKVSDVDYPAAVDLLRRNHAHMEKID
ncbi:MULTISPECIES: hypothetical protein [unclassified Paenibacillus]|uniref:hypothetical protein n=1 Tax=unclassified Paenibacillus TaxID=185978 RepID=UPI0007103C3B|nr:MULTISPECIES: hypothetical protein [unclassified Paenibacillus]KQX46572.1 hypothetical protein ASD40_14820 [Paenibacillus sp. Root444D2]KRE34028.1 hypothetical protein ASG85_11625 [Paenibacillus sp. Soil724D2]